MKVVDFTAYKVTGEQIEPEQYDNKLMDYRDREVITTILDDIIARFGK